MRRSLAALVLTLLVASALVAPAMAAKPSPSPSPEPVPTVEPTPSSDPAPSADPAPSGDPSASPEPTSSLDPTPSDDPTTPPPDPDPTASSEPSTEPTPAPNDPADPTEAPPSAEPSASADADAAVDGSAYIVMLKGNADTAAVIARHRKQDKTKAERTFRNAFRGFTAKLDKRQRSALLADPNVVAVVPDEPIELAAQTIPTGISRVGTRQSDTANIDGVDQRVDADIAIVDTGISRHPDLNVVGGYNCVPGASTGVPDPGLWRDRHGHGTHVAGTAAAIDNTFGVVGIAPGARLWAVRVINDSGSGMLSWYACGIDWIAGQRDPQNQNRPLIEAVNMSITKWGRDDGACGAINDDILHEAICGLVGRGVTVVVAAANDSGSAAARVPGSYNEVITVSALADSDGKPGGLGGNRCYSWGTYDSDDTFANFSNYGSDVDLIAPGKCIWSTYYNGSYTYAYLSGTSMAAPTVTGAVALYKASRPSATPAQVKEALQFLGNLDWFVTTDPDGTHERLLEVSRIGPLGTFSFADTTPSVPISRAGGQTTLPFTIERSATYFERVWFKVTDLPSGWSASWSPSSIMGWNAETTTLNLTVPAGTLAGTYEIGVEARGVGTTQEHVGLVVVGEGGAWTSITPSRRLDTRAGIGFSSRFASGVVRTFTVVGDGIPADALAITGNLTVTGPTASGYVSIGPSMTSSPGTSTLNVGRNQTVANGVTVQLANGRLSAVYVGSGGSTTHLILDVTGYFRAGDGATWRPLGPSRILDTRSGLGLEGPFISRGVRTLQVGGRGGVPSGAIAVSGNVTVVGATSSGYLSVGPTMTTTPSTSTLNFPNSRPVANNLTVRLSSTGKIRAIIVGRPNAQAHVIFDVTGYYVAGDDGAHWYPVPAKRILDTRTGRGLSGVFMNATPRSFQVAGSALPADVVAVTANLTATASTGTGYVAAGPTIDPHPSTSTVNFTTGQTRANGLTLRTTSDGRAAAVYVGTPRTGTHVILDVTGYFR